MKKFHTAPESNKQNPQDRTLDLLVIFRYKHIIFRDHLSQLRRDCVRLSNKYAKIVMLSARFLNQTNEIRETEL